MSDVSALAEWGQQLLLKTLLEQDAQRQYAYVRIWRMLPGHFDWHDRPGYFERASTTTSEHEQRRT